MKRFYLKKQVSSRQIREQLSSTGKVSDYRRKLCVSLVHHLPDIDSNTIASILGISKPLVHQTVQTFNSKGWQGIKTSDKGGRKWSLLTLEQESALMKKLESHAVQGEIISSDDIRKEVEKQVGNKVSDDYLWDLFNRHGWRKKSPRPQHPSSDKKQQEAFKKNSQKVWLPSSMILE